MGRVARGTALHQLLFKVLACGPRRGVPLRGVLFMFRFVHESSEWARSALGRGRCLCSLYLRLWPGVRVVVRKVVRRYSSCCISAPLSCGYFLRTHRGGSGWAGGKSSAVSPDLGILIRHWGTSALFSTVPHRFFCPSPNCHCRPFVHCAPAAPADFFWWGVADAGEKSLWALFASSGGFLTPLRPRAHVIPVCLQPALHWPHKLSSLPVLQRALAVCERARIAC